MTKILRIFFIVLLFITLAETGYLLIASQSPSKSSISTNLTENSPSPILDSSKIQEASNPLISEETINSIKTWSLPYYSTIEKTNLGRKITLTDTYEAFIGDIEKDSEKPDRINITLVDDQNRRVFYFNIGPKALINTYTFKKLNDSKEIDITIDDLKKNDKVRVTEIQDWTVHPVFDSDTKFLVL